MTYSSNVYCVLTEIGAEFGDVRPLDSDRMRKLTVNGVQLLDRIDPNHAFVTDLANTRCITWPQRQHVLDLVHVRDRNNKLLEFLIHGSVAGFEKFIQVLSKEQEFLVPLLVTDGGETFFECIWEFSSISHCIHMPFVRCNKWLISSRMVTAK